MICLFMILTHDGKDDNDSKHGGEAVGESHNEGIPQAVVVGGIIGRVSNKTSKSKAKRKEYLSSSFKPNNWVCQLAPLKK